MEVTNVIALAILVVLATLGGAAGGVVVAAATLRRERSPGAPMKVEQPRIEELTVNLSLAELDDGPRLNWQISTRGAEITACLVERWLSERWLVMSPKGQDFKAAAAPKEAR